MPAVISADWTAMRAMYTKGVPAKQISEQTGISFPALRQRIRRERWDDDVTKAEQALSHAVTRDMAKAASEWVAKIDTFVHDAIDAVAKRDKSSLSVKDLKMLVETADAADRIARRTYALDAPQQPQLGISVNLSVTAAGGGGALPVHVIDADVADTEASDTEPAPAALLMPA